jgi:peptide/nickel transport system permease protein
MTRYIIRKLIQTVVILLLVTLVAQTLSVLVPGSLGELILGEGAGQGAIDKFNHEYGLDRPFWERYWSWITHALQGDLGRSIQTRQTVTHVLVERLPVTLELAILGVLLSLLIAVPIAVYCAMREDQKFDRIATAISSAADSIPGFVACVLLAAGLTAQYRVFPTFGWVNLTKDPADNLVHAALPLTVLVLGISPLFLRVLRADLVSTLREDFVLAAQARGMSDTYIMVRHVLRPASMSLFTLTGLVFGYLMGGSIIVESYFSLPGVGQVVAQAVANNDLPTVQGVVVLVALVFLVVNSLVDIGYRLLNPQVGAQL